MKKHISIVMAAIGALSMGLHPASASLLGMPLNLKAAIEFRDASVMTPALEFNGDEVFPGQALVRDC